MWQAVYFPGSGSLPRSVRKNFMAKFGATVNAICPILAKSRKRHVSKQGLCGPGQYESGRARSRLLGGSFGTHPSRHGDRIVASRYEAIPGVIGPTICFVVGFTGGTRLKWWPSVPAKCRKARHSLAAVAPSKEIAEGRVKCSRQKCGHFRDTSRSTVYT
jgi:hypothetical protein